jgi:hypothetical protein
MIINLFHGTNFDYAQSILANGFTIFPSNEDWLGYGVYFFAEGVSCPVENALEWAKNKYASTPIAILRSTIEVDEGKLLDLRNIKSLYHYNQVKNRLINKHYDVLSERRDLEIKKRKDIRVDDRIITNLIAEQLGVDVIIHNTYIKNSKQRVISLESSYPNTSVCCVRDLKCIKETTLLLSRLEPLDLATLSPRCDYCNAASANTCPPYY